MTLKIREPLQERSDSHLSMQFTPENSHVMEGFFSALMPPTSSEQFRPTSIPEENPQLSFEFQTSRPQVPESSSIESQLEPRFKSVDFAELGKEDFALLDKCRSLGWWVPTVQEFADQLLNGVYDVWEYDGPDEVKCFLLTTFETFPSGEKWLSLNYVVGKNCKPEVDRLHMAFFELADRLGCTQIVCQMKEERFVRFMKYRATRLTTLYRLERI